jgi:hypothetical protein
MSPPLTPQARALVAAARADLEPSADDLERMRRRILLVAGGAAGLASVSSASAAGASGGGASAAGAGASAASAGAAGIAAATGLHAGVKIGLVLLVAGAAAAGGAALVAREPTATPPVVTRAAPSTPPSTPAPAVRPLAPAEPEIELEFAPDRIERPRRAAGPRRAAEPRPAEAEPPPSLSQELTLVRRARAALRLGMPDRALELLAEHARRFAAPRLAQEAAVVRIEAMCAVGDLARARSLTEAFGRTWPRSPLRARVGNMCGARP